MMSSPRSQSARQFNMDYRQATTSRGGIFRHLFPVQRSRFCRADKACVNVDLFRFPDRSKCLFLDETK